MTLSTRIAALTKADREIDGAIADLLGWWPKGYTRHCIHGSDRRYKATRGHLVSTEYLDCPNYTANIMHVLEECDKRGLFYGGTNDGEAWGAEFNVWNSGYDCDGVQRTDRNITLAACEALVRAVENNTNDA